MAALVVVVMLVGAFLGTRRSFIALSRYSAEQQACRDTLRSLADFCRFRLEGQESWGRLPGEADDAVTFRDAAGHVVFELKPIATGEAQGKAEFQGMRGLAYFEGVAPRAAVKFQLSISNNLHNDLPNEAAGVGAKACRLEFRASRSAHAERVEVMLRRAAFFDSTVAASGEIEIDADELNFSSKDPLRNQIRSKSDILLPDIPNITFTPDPDVQTPEKGTVWAQGDIKIDGNSSEERLNQAADQTGGEFLPNAPTRYSVPELKKADLDADGSKPIRLLAPRCYYFVKETVYYLDTDGVERERQIPSLRVVAPNVDPGDGQVEQFYWVKDALFLPLAGDTPDEPTVPLDHTPDPDTVYIKFGNGQTMTGIMTEEREIEIAGGPDVEMPVALYDPPKVLFDAEVDYRVRGDGGRVGDFKIASFGAEATIDFVDHDPDPERPQEGFLSVDRDLVIQGQMNNCGKLLAGRDVELLPRDVTVDKIEEGNDLAVYAGRNVMIRPLMSEDDAMRADARRYFVFRGLVYAGDDFDFRSSVVRQGQTYRFDRKLFIEGALVARRGDVFIQGNETVELKYNPKFLDDLLQNSFDEDHAQLEELSWRPL